MLEKTKVNPISTKSADKENSDFDQRIRHNDIVKYEISSSPNAAKWRQGLNPANRSIWVSYYRNVIAQNLSNTIMDKIFPPVKLTTTNPTNIRNMPLYACLHAPTKC